MNVEELLLAKNIMFKKAGQRITIRCLNPEHEDRNPSMSVDPITGAIYCFSCGYGKGTTLYSHFGIMNNERDLRVQKVLKLISKVRNPEITIPRGTIPFKESYRGISGDTYEKHGAFTSFNEFKDCIVFPVRSASGKLTALLSRHLGTEHGTRYIMYPANAVVPFYPAIPKPHLSSVIIVEGIFDYLKAYENGLTNCIALLGAHSSKTDVLMSTLTILNVSRVILALDNDDAGRKATAELKDKLSTRFANVEVLDFAEYNLNDMGSASPSAISVMKRKLYEDCTGSEVPTQASV